MKHTIEQSDRGLRILATVDPAKQQALLVEFGKCAAGTCACPTPQYQKLESMQVSSQEGALTVDLKVKTGEVVDVADIETCLDHTARLLGA
jgi:hypothetical protein